MKRRTLLLWLIWLAGLGLLTWGLLSPAAPEVNRSLLPEQLRYPASKGIHLIGYAGVSALVGWLPVGRLGRLLLWLLLVCHAGLTEYLQRFIPNRSSSLVDVGFDLAGILLGLAVPTLVQWKKD
jgi:hypothetical protein